MTTEGIPVTKKEPWVNLFVARPKRRIPLALTGCVLTRVAWERTGAASGAVASHLNSISQILENICIAQDILENMNTTQDALSGTGYNVYSFALMFRPPGLQIIYIPHPLYIARVVYALLNDEENYNPKMMNTGSSHEYGLH